MMLVCQECRQQVGSFHRPTCPMNVQKGRSRARRVRMSDHLVDIPSLPQTPRPTPVPAGLPTGQSWADRDEMMRAACEPGGTVCPCCEQHVQVYRRKLNSGMAVSATRIYRRALVKGSPFEWVHIPTELPARSREEGKLAYWGLLEEMAEPRGDGGRSGWWRLTSRGVRFALGHERVPRYVEVYNNTVVRRSEETTDIRAALGDRFSYNELMGRNP